MHRTKRNIFKPLSLSLFVLLVVSLFVAFKPTPKNDYVISHRGASGEEIEHTFKSYDLALGYGTKYIEQDLVTSKDGTLYVSHDENAERLTGVDKNYKDMTDDEIAKLRTDDDQYILKLEDVFKKYEDSTYYAIELKEKDNSGAIKPFENLVKKYDLEDKIIVQARNKGVLESLNTSFPGMPKLILVNNDDELDNALKQDYVDIIGANADLMNKDNVKKAHDNDKDFNVWTLNSTDEIKKAIDLNVDSYFTNYTAKALTIEDNYR
ncbi:glycerophosphodiester phosphodiesterase [Tetragenococcus halophilus]|nr:glycerophosphodiester phosphodiesterase [Tetragenococcus halophilus]NWO01017.1 glycerophosphodiester phosphodiesterase [Tetragenococcus halophilus]RQD33119.1 glycerophosphodiester phosphodiesterase [Tetragenococcus halophilus subsp. halophilus DSM 20339]GBD60253.1 putative hydrolase [Tetragenococcus halophilus subsp. halophilus]GBD71150.1 putative hydrolase [Tetragenococcus halophilus subsp. halophilus]GBD74135.1 putative hydrolase [Tetragenococcus halophilus subsp. halophilus]